MMSITAMAAEGDRPHRPVATYSIVARHAVTGEMVFAMQSLANPACDPRGLSEPAWGARVFDLRVEDNADPLIELRRLVTLARAYRLMSAGDEHMTDREIPKAVEAYSGAEALVPDSHKMVFWHAAAMAAAGDVDTTLPLFEKAFDAWPKWRELVKRLPAAEFLPDDPELMQRILAIE
jgi:hypothetical protein